MQDVSTVAQIAPGVYINQNRRPYIKRRIFRQDELGQTFLVRLVKRP